MTVATTAPSALEFPPTSIGTEMGGNGAKPPTPDAQAAAAIITKQQKDGEPPRDTLKSLAATKPSKPESDNETPSAQQGSIARSETTAAKPSIVPESESATTLPVEKPEQTEKINHLLREAVNHLVGRHDPRFVLMASAMAASPQTPLGSELRKNALITLRDLEPRKGLWGIFDKRSLVLNNATSGFLEKADQPSSAALVGFLKDQIKLLPADIKNELIPAELEKRMRLGSVEVPDLIDFFSRQQSPHLIPIRESLHHETTGRPEGRMPTLNDPREMLIAAGVDNLWNRLQIKQMIHPEQFNTRENLTRYGPIAFILFMSALQMFPQDQKQQAAGH